MREGVRGRVGGPIDSPQEKLSSKSPALSGLRQVQSNHGPSILALDPFTIF